MLFELISVMIPGTCCFACIPDAIRVVTIMISQRRTFRRFLSLGMNPKCFGPVVLCLVLLTFVANGVHAQVDITEKVRRNTVLDKEIKDFCANYCQGNRREGHLTAVTVQSIGNGRYRGAMTADLRNWQETGEPFNVTIYDWVVRVRTEGLLDSSTCMVTIDSVTVDNDIYGIFSGILDGLRGRKYQISNCKRLLPSAAPVPMHSPGR
jgi:hypothetical protein